MRHCKLSMASVAATHHCRTAIGGILEPVNLAERWPKAGASPTALLGAGVQLSGGSAALDKLLKRRGRAADAASHHLPGYGDRAADAGRTTTLRPPFGHCGAVAGHGSQLD